jgi:hypothetical protein
VTQQSVIARVGMAEVIRDFRDGSIVTVEWPTLVDIVEFSKTALLETPAKSLISVTKTQKRLQILSEFESL